MSRNDIIGLGISIGIHALLLVGFALITTATQPLPMGFVEVEFGDFALGQRVQQQTEEQPLPPEEEPVPEPLPEPEVTPREEPAARAEEPVNLPDQPEPPPEEEPLPPPEAEKPAPEPRKEPRAEPGPEKPEPEKKEVKPLGRRLTQDTQGKESGKEGEGSDEKLQAPYLLVGLNRTPVFAPLPRYTEKVDAVIQYQITVDPEGKIIRMIPIRKGSPALEAAVQEALRKWRFNPLRPGVPRENQTGTITFRFTLH